jgi:hypothetical protein
VYSWEFLLRFFFSGCGSGCGGADKGGTVCLEQGGAPIHGRTGGQDVVTQQDALAGEIDVSGVKCRYICKAFLGGQVVLRRP